MKKFLKWLDEVPLLPLVVIAVLLGLAPLNPEPHLLEKLRMLMQGTLVRPLDIFDLFLHATPQVLLLLRLFRMATQRSDKGAG